MIKWSSGQKQKYMFTQTLFYVWRCCQILQKQTEDGKAKWQTFKYPLLTKNCWESMENQLSSSGIFSQDLHHCRFFQIFQNDLQERNIEPENFGERFINDIEWTRKRNEENCILNSEKVKTYAKRFSQGDWTFLETKRSGMGQVPVL